MNSRDFSSLKWKSMIAFSSNHKSFNESIQIGRIWILACLLDSNYRSERKMFPWRNGINEVNFHVRQNNKIELHHVIFMKFSTKLTQ